ncbi:hypothetical protein [Sphingomonas montanisoli]|uniref:Uncharacterized protein n=1 Tax=Sphingomonas montanisoli TaxID=2606412 RepID=A0A5D9BZQ1_9SPHN|nr:hypothetical protein [Sphingomonas montanisoli]TZG24886.1 hypothetical protein FYJ91_16525 [Sphingomonas montanisoli]
MIGAAIRLLRGAKLAGVSKTVTPQPSPIAAGIDAALETRRRARAARAAAADAGHAARKAQRLPDPVVSAWRN